MVKNVFDFDGYSSERLETVHEVFRKHGIPLGKEFLLNVMKEKKP